MVSAPKAEEKIVGPLIGRKQQTHFAGAPSKGFGNCRHSGRQVNLMDVVDEQVEKQQACDGKRLPVQSELPRALGKNFSRHATTLKLGRVFILFN
jgi:hypothetical protein